MEELSYNKKARFDYEILEEIQAGIALTGHEVKSAKLGRFNLIGSYVTCMKNEVFLLGAQIASFQPNNAPNDYDARRTRKLLLKKKEIAHLTSKKESGLAIIPLRAFLKKNRVKVTVAVARGRKKYDKRELLKKRAAQREIEREVKQ